MSQDTSYSFDINESDEIRSISNNSNSNESKETKESKESKTSENPYRTVIHEWLATPKQIYRGSLLYDNLHGSGIYFINKEEKIFYDGFFYANKMEGYCQVFYHSNEAHFQGLFKDNRRFGPGILTYSDGSQDVGIWDGFSLVRVGRLPNSCIPTLTITNEGHIKILKYRNLVDVCQKEAPDIAEELLKSLGASEELLCKAHKLYSKDVKNKKNLFFNKRIYDRYYPEKVPIIDILIEDHMPSPPPSKVVILGDDYESEPEPETEEERQQMNILSKKVYMLNNQLDEVGRTLHNIKGELTIVNKKIQYCIKCCQQEEEMIGAEGEAEHADTEKADKVKYLSDLYDSPSVLPLQDDIPSNFSINLADFSMTNNGHSAIQTPFGTPGTQSESIIRDSPNLSYEEYLGQDECLCLENMEIENLVDLETKQRTLTKEEIFFEKIFKHLSLEIEKILRIMKFRKNVHTKKIVVNEILAWNNEPLIIEMLKHSFFFRNTEHMVNFRVPAVLAGHRTGFKTPGFQETRCYEFFIECNRGTTLNVIRYLREFKVNVSVTDAKGNSGIFFATVNNKTDIIRILVQFGANSNQINDDGLTPLSLSLLNYLAKKYNIDNWESAFIPDTIVSPEDQQELKSWYPSRSFLTVTAVSKHSRISLAASAGKKQPATKMSRTSIKKTACIFSTKFPTTYLSDAKDDASHRISTTDPSPGQLMLIEICIKTLIEYGANPNYGESPLPTFLISIYTENLNIVRSLLNKGANPNIVTPDENLNALHILASSKCIEENISIANLLLSFNCNPNTRTSMTHWIDQKHRLIENAEYEIEDLGKNVLHLLCMRMDFMSDNCGFFEEMATLLLTKINVESTYLELDALRLAMTSGNLNLVDLLLKTGLFDPFQNIPDEGNVLTMFFSDRFQKMLPESVIRQVIELLVERNVNPLTPFDEFDNVLDYVNKVFKAKIKGTRTSLLKSPTKFFYDLEEFMRSLITRKIFENIESNVTNLLYDFAEDKELEHELLRPLLEYINPEKFLRQLKVLFNHGRIEFDRFDKDLILNIMAYLTVECIPPVILKVPSTSKTDILTDYSDFIDPNDFRKIISCDQKIMLKPPGLDEQSKYLVCFECLVKLEEIFSCPQCQLIHYCSKKCYLINLKRKTDNHPCKVRMFLDHEDYEAYSRSHGIMEKWALVKERCKNRLENRWQKEEEIRQFLEEEANKKNIYGIKRKPRKSTEQIQDPSKAPALTFKPNVSQMSKDQMIEVSQKLQRLSNLSEKRDNSLKELLSPSKVKTSKTNGDNEIISVQKSVEFKNKIEPKKVEKGTKQRDICPTSVICKRDKTRRSRSCVNVSDIISKYPETFVSSHFEPLPDLKEPYIIKKTRKVPSKPHLFMEILTKLFPDIDLSELLLPYTCYSDGGHLYYQFNNTNLFCRNYSIL